MWTILVAVLAAIAAGVLFVIVLNLYELTCNVLHRVKMLKLDREVRRQALDAAKPLYPDAAGNFPLLLAAKKDRILDPGRGLLYTVRDGLLAATAEIARPEQLRRLLQGAGGWPAGQAASNLLEAPQATAWPEVVDLRGLFVNRQPSIEDLVVGVTVTENGQRVLSASIHDLMHVLAVGASGWGKSSWLRSLLWQLALAREPVEVVAVDVSGSEFNALRGWGKLRYPVAREPEEAAALLNEVSEEVTRRKELYEAYPLASNLPEYNAQADEPLVPWVILVDEGTALLNEGGIGKHLRRGVQTSRQYACYFVVTGQSANHKVIETQTRDQFSTRLCFRTSPTSSRVVLDDGAASAISAKGRAWVQLVGRKLCEVQGPYITKEELAKALTNSGPRYPMPEIVVGSNGDEEGRIRELAEQGLSKRQISLEVFGYAGGAAYEAVTKVLG